MSNMDIWNALPTDPKFLCFECKGAKTATVDVYANEIDQLADKPCGTKIEPCGFCSGKGQIEAWFAIGDLGRCNFPKDQARARLQETIIDPDKAGEIEALLADYETDETMMARIHQENRQAG